MTTLTDKFKITIRVADLPDITLNISRDEEEVYREIVKQINKMWSDLIKRRPEMTTQDILAVVAIKFAKRLYDAANTVKAIKADSENRQNEIDIMLNDFESSIDKILLKIEE